MGVSIKNVQGLTAEVLRAEVGNGARFVQFDYTISIVVMTFKRSTDIYFVRHDASHWKHSLPFTMISLVLGWWGIPWGFIYTPMALYTNLSGGRDLTREVLAYYADSRITQEETASLTKERW